MSAGQNSVTRNKFVQKEFDPFRERTITWLSKEVTTKLDKTKDHRGDELKVKLAHWKSESFDFIRLGFIYPVTSKNFKYLMSRTEFTDIKFNCDLENVQPIKISFDRELDAANDSSVGTAAVDFSIEDSRKISACKNLEIRIYRQSGQDDMDDVFEKKICEALASLIKHGVDYDWQSEADRLEKIALEKQAVKPKSFLGKIFSAVKWIFGLIVVLGVLDALFGK